jgi:peptidoglycan/LPS O-acetylase OafA/YrhL
MVRTALLSGLFFAVVFTCLMPGTPGARVFSWTPLRWLGNMSYSYYLLHGLTINVVALVFGSVVASRSPGAPDGFYWLMMPVTFAATLASSTVLFAAVERPLSLREGRPPREVAAAGITRPTLASGA